MWKFIAVCLILFICWISSGCAAITGTITGLGTGAVDLPAEVYRYNPDAFYEHPILYGVNVLIFVPVGIATGPVVGFFKGISLDVQWLVDKIDYGEVFGTYGDASIWRPHTWHWETSGTEGDVD